MSIEQGSSYEDTLNSDLNPDGLDSYSPLDLPGNEPAFGQQLPQDPNDTDNGQQYQEQEDPNWKNRATYFQSQYDKARNELNQYAPLINHINQNPQVLDRLLQDLEQKHQPEETGPRMPEAPQVPQGYNEAEAYTDPESESFKYRVAQQNYQQNLINFMIEKDKMAEETANKIMQQEMAKRQKYEQEIQIKAQAANVLMQRYGYSEAQVIDFINTFSKPEAIGFDDMVALHQMKAGGGIPQSQRVQQTPQRQYYPTPAGVGLGARRNTDPNTLFNQTFFGKPKGR